MRRILMVDDDRVVLHLLAKGEAAFYVASFTDASARKRRSALVAWGMKGLKPPRISLNISPRQFRQPSLVSRIRATLEATGVSAGQLEVEMTESALMERPEQAVRQLQELKALGMGIVVDDFGTGYSSLAYLKKFPIDKLKIDRSFVGDLLQDKSDREITLAVIALSHNLGLRVVAEGVEEQA